MTEKEAIELFEKDHFLQEQKDIEKDINDITSILSRYPIDIEQVKAKIKKINDDHSENIFLNRIVFTPHRTSSPGGYIPDQDYINDLIWKRLYLQAKKSGKLFEEFCQEMRKLFSSEAIGGA